MINIKENGLKERKMDLVCIYLPMEMFMKDNSKMEIDKDKEATLGLIKVITKASGLLTK